jgi:hypothetical protein
MKRNLTSKIFFLLAGLLFITSSQAICPICTIAVGAGIGLAQWLGIDDTITGLWVGGFTVSISIWTITWLSKKNIRFLGRKPLIFICYYALVLIPLYMKKIIGHPLNTLWGYDKLLLGIIIGSIAFAAGAIIYQIMKKKNANHAYFPFQKVLMPLAPLIILSIIFCFITR